MKQRLADRKVALFIVISLIVVIAMLGVTLWATPFLNSFMSRLDFRDRVVEWGVFGWLAVLGLQILQIIIAFIPGEIVQVLCGMLYGSIGGMLTCLLGCVIASTLVFSVMKRVGKPFIDRMIGEGNMRKWGFLRNPETTDAAVFIAFLIPGTPKDALTYLASFTEIPLWRFLLISTVARIPALVASTMIGANMQKGKWVITLVVVCAVLIACFFSLLYRERVMAFLASLKRGKVGRQSV